jgi:hypothetical protein
MVCNTLAAKVLRERNVSGDALKMIRYLEDLSKIWETMDTCYERPEKYMAEVLKPILEFRKYRMYDNASVRKFYSLLRTTVKTARTVWHLRLLINDHTVPRIMGRMLHGGWEEWVTNCTEWIHKNVEDVFERFVEQNLKDPLNVAAAELANWEARGSQS